jgi:hypothetical protein
MFHASSATAFFFLTVIQPRPFSPGGFMIGEVDLWLDLFFLKAGDNKYSRTNASSNSHQMK